MGKLAWGQLGPTPFLLGGKAFRWLNRDMPSAVFTPETLPPAQPGKIRYGVIGCPIAHSLSPAMQLAGFEALGLPAEYFRIEVPAGTLAHAIPLLLQSGLQGWNCTLPHKKEMFNLVAKKDSSALEAQSVNTIRVEKGQLHGFSTDAAGWETALQETWQLATDKLRVLILGCGGVGQTLARHLTESGCAALTLTNREPKRATELLRELQSSGTGRFPIQTIPWELSALQTALSKTDLLVQATSLGMRDEDSLPFPFESLHPPLRVYDTIYRKNLTPLVRAARQRDCPAIDGLGMLLHQGTLSFEIWTGKKAPRTAMQAALEQSAGRKI